MYKLYISYANEDYDLAIKIQDALKNNNINSSIIDHTSLNVNGDIAEAMYNEIKKYENILFLFSAYANESNFFAIELNAAVKRNKKIYILLLDESNMSDELRFTTSNSIFLKYSGFKNSIKSLSDLITNGDENE